MEVFEAIAKRHSYRGKFQNKAIPKDDLIKIVTAGTRAPSGCNAQTTEFVIINNQDQIIKIAHLLEKDFIKTAKAIIICLVQKAEVYHGESFEKEDCAAAVENMLLAITALGYATVWLDGVLRREGRAEQIADMIKAPSGLQVQVVLPLGVPVDAVKQREKKPFDMRAWFDHYPKR